MPKTAPAPLLAADLTAGTPAPNGTPIVCCDTVMAVEGDAQTCDRTCLDCSTVIATLHGIVQPITR